MSVTRLRPESATTVLSPPLPHHPPLPEAFGCLIPLPHHCRVHRRSRRITSGTHGDFKRIPFATEEKPVTCRRSKPLPFPLVAQFHPGHPSIRGQFLHPESIHAANRHRVRPHAPTRRRRPAQWPHPLPSLLAWHEIRKPLPGTLTIKPLDSQDQHYRNRLTQFSRLGQRNFLSLSEHHAHPHPFVERPR